MAGLGGFGAGTGGAGLSGGGAYVGTGGPKNVGLGATGYTGPDPAAERRRKQEEASARSMEDYRRKQREREESVKRQRRESQTRQEEATRRREMDARMDKLQQSMQPIGGGGAAPGPPLGSPGAITGGAPGGGGVGAGGIESAVGADPNLQFWEGQRREELEAAKAPVDTSREKGMAATSRMGAQAGEEAQLEEEMAGRGLGTGAGIGAELARRSGEGAQTDVAMAGAGIDMEAERQRKARMAAALAGGSAYGGQIGEGARAGQRLNLEGQRVALGQRAQDVTMRGQDINAQMGQMGLWANLMAGLG